MEAIVFDTRGYDREALDRANARSGRGAPQGVCHTRSQHRGLARATRMTSIMAARIVPQKQNACLRRRVSQTRLRTRATAGADRNFSRSGSCSGNEFASRIIVARLMPRCKRADSRFPDCSSMWAAVACTRQEASGTSKPCTVDTASSMHSRARSWSRFAKATRALASQASPCQVRTASHAGHILMSQSLLGVSIGTLHSWRSTHALDDSLRTFSRCGGDTSQIVCVSLMGCSWGVER
jgi:hypothetical protein